MTSDECLTSGGVVALGTDGAKVCLMNGAGVAVDDPPASGSGWADVRTAAIYFFVAYALGRVFREK